MAYRLVLLYLDANKIMRVFRIVYNSSPAKILSILKEQDGKMTKYSKACVLYSMEQ